MFPEDRALYEKFDKEGLKITGYPYAGDVYHQFAIDTAAQGLGGTGDTPLFGHSPDFGYFYFGIPWYGDEIWNGGRFTDYDKDGKFDDWEVFRWIDENRAGKGDFKDWTAYKHPQLGDVEIGGLNPKFYAQNPPPDLGETWFRNEALWNLWMAEQLPQVRITAATATPAKGAPGIFDVTMTVTNEGLMPTAMEMAKRVKIVRPDTCIITLPKGVEIVKPFVGKVPQTAIEIDSIKPGETKTATWQVKGSGTATVAISSTRGGVDKREVTVQ